MRVKDIMKEPIAIENNISIKEAAKVMAGKRISSLIVLKKGKIMGIITERDVLKNISGLGKGVFDIMTKNVITIPESENIDNAAVIMAQHQIKRLPAVNKNGKLTGIITATDLIAHAEDIGENFFFE